MTTDTHTTEAPAAPPASVNTTETVIKTEVIESAAPAPSVPAPISTEEPPLSSKRPEALTRCHYRYSNGRRCTLPGLAAKSGFCLRHYNRQVAAGLPLVPVPDDFADLSSDLLGGELKFSSAEDLRESLTRLLILMTQGRVSPRRACGLAYITNQLLHSHVVAEKEADEPQPFVFDLPRPKRD
ncbi:MAG TPA: hypothetical protein VJN89_01565 [Candidatus Acidoferrum sp.]|nr:hypothetical protein [Candidatus Acidoferrum sp.]